MNNNDRSPSPGSEKAARNSAFLLGSQVITKIASFGGVILLARLLEVADFGVYSLALAVTGIVSLLVELGLDQLSIREVARDRSRLGAYLANSIIVKSSLALLALAVTAIVLSISGFAEGSGTIILIFTLALIPSGIVHSATAMFMGIERMGRVALINTAGEILRLALAATVLLSGYGLVQVAWSYVFASILTASLALIVLRKASEASFWSPDFSKLRAIIKESVPFMFFGLFFLIYFKIDFIMLAAYKSETEVGTYAAAFRLIESLMFIPAAFMGAVFPGLSRLSIRGNNSVLDAANKTLRYMMMLGLPIGFGIAILAERIVFSLFGSAYANSVVPLQIIVWALVLIFINCICPVGLNSVNRQRLSVVVVGVGIIFNISLNFMLIPPFGAIGTSIATVATELFTTILFIYFFHRYIGELKLFTTFYRPLAAALVMSAALLVFSFLPLGALIPLGALVYLSALLLLGALGRGDYDLVLSLAQPRTARLRG